MRVSDFLYMPLQYIIATGEAFRVLHQKNGFSSHTIWNHLHNVALKQKRRHMNILMLGEIIPIPYRQLKHFVKAIEQERGQVKNLLIYLMNFSIFLLFSLKIS